MYVRYKHLCVNQKCLIKHAYSRFDNDLLLSQELTPWQSVLLQAHHHTYPLSPLVSPLMPGSCPVNRRCYRMSSIGEPMQILGWPIKWVYSIFRNFWRVFFMANNFATVIPLCWAYLSFICLNYLLQLSAQAAQHEAIQRQLAMERERFGHMPPHWGEVRDIPFPTPRGIEKSQNKTCSYVTFKSVLR